MTDLDKIFEDFDFEEYDGIQLEDKNFWKVTENSLNNKELPVKMYKFILKTLKYIKGENYWNTTSWKDTSGFYVSYKNNEFSWMPFYYRSYGEDIERKGYDYYIKTGFKYMGEL